MKKIVLFLSLVLTALTSCHKDDVMSYGEAMTQQFTQAFTQTYGQPETGHNWGFRTTALTRGHNVNGNLWYQDWKRPVNVTDDEISKVKAEFAKQRIGAHNDISIDWRNYWVQQVHKGDSSYVDGNGNPCGGNDNASGIASNCMNHILAFNNLKENVICWWPKEVEYSVYEGAYEHINNFNNGNNTTTYTDDVTAQQYVGTTLMVNMGTDGRYNQFSYHNTVDSKDHYEYIILNIDGAYYLGFDFYAEHPEGQEANKNMDVERDWVFDDWIIKITPAIPANEEDKYIVDAGRIIAEDLGNSEGSDFDYNDVVFDFELYNDNSVEVVLQAAGGTLPLYIDGVEVHGKFGVNTNVMINTSNFTEKSPVRFTLPNKYSQAVDIPITVDKFGSTYTIPWFSGAPSAKLSVPQDFQWTHERTPIQQDYPKFKQYVVDHTINWYLSQ